MLKFDPKRPEPMLWLADNRGIYIPQHFAESFSNPEKHVSGVSESDWKTLLEGPETEWYWEAWDTICNNCVVTDDFGNQFFIHQDGDCWLIPKGWVWSDEAEFFVEATEPTNDEDQQ